MNDSGGFFGVERILQLANKASKVTPKGLITALNDEVSAYRGSYLQSDDITMLACSRLGAGHAKSSNQESNKSQQLKNHLP